MLTMTLKVNGKDISNLRIINKGEYGKRKYGIFKYAVDGGYTDMNGKFHMVHMELKHRRTDGAWPLIEKIAKEMQK